MTHVLVVRLDRPGDVLICGPAVRAVAAGADRVTMLVSAAGAVAAGLLPGVDEHVVWNCPWIAFPPPATDADDVADVVRRIAAVRADEAVVLTSFHQSALPTALLLRLAGIERVAAVSTDYPGDLLTTRISEPADDPEPLRMLAIAREAGFAPAPGDDLRLRVRSPGRSELTPDGPYVVVHPGADAPARAYPAASWRAVAHELGASGYDVVVTGGPGETALTAQVAHGLDRAVDLGGRTDFAQLAAVLAGASAVAVGNTGPAHLAAAVGTPVVSLFSPVVPARRWAPHGVPVVLLGDLDAPCRGTRARRCPVPGHPCLGGVDPHDVVAAVTSLCGRRDLRTVS